MNTKQVKLAGAFKFIYLILAMITFSTFTSRTAVNQYFSYIVFAFGVAVFLFRLITFKEYKNTKGLYLLIAFSVLSVVSALVNFRYGGMTDLIENAQSLSWMLFSFFILYTYNAKTTKEDIQKEFKGISYFLLLYNFVACVIGIGMLAVNCSMIVVRNGETVLGGFLWNRLWGVYTDPNHGAVVAAVCILLSLYYILIRTKTVMTILHVINILLCEIYVACSDSRTGLVTLMAALAAFTYLYFRKRQIRPIDGKRILKCTFCLVLACVVALFPYFSSNIVKTTVSVIMTHVAPADPPIDNTADPSIDGTQGGKKPNDNPFIIGRNENLDNNDISNDPSNRRFDIWKSGLDIVKKTPLVGASFRGIVSFAEKELPDTYILNNDAGKFSCMHNSLLDILVAQGILGFVVFAAFAVLVIVTCLRSIFKVRKTEDYLLLSVLYAIILLIAISSLFLSQIIFINSIGGILFWIMLGYAVDYAGLASSEE